MYRFFVEPQNIKEDSIVITGQDVNHIKNVLRMKTGEEILLSDGNDREYRCSIQKLENDKIEAKILDIDGPCRELPVKVYLFQGLPKGDKMETVIQKMIELGAYSIVPVKTKRSIVKLDDKKAANKVKRWNLIAESAAKQSKRGIIPKVENVCTFANAIDMAKKLDLILMPYEEAENMEVTRNALKLIKPGMSVGIFIGPEGGFAGEEVDEVVNVCGKPITLGKRILRTETAGMAIMSVIMFQMEE